MSYAENLSRTLTSPFEIPVFDFSQKDMPKRRISIAEYVLVSQEIKKVF
jgi:hypothetical protein